MNPSRIEDALRAWHTRRQELLENDPELENDEASLIDLLGPELGEVDDILARLIHAAMHADTMETNARNAARNAATRAKRFADRSDKLRATAKEIMESTGLRRLELDDATVTIKAGSPSTKETDIDLVPDQYKTVTVTLRKSIILPLLKAGERIPGVELSNSEPTLYIKVS